MEAVEASGDCTAEAVGVDVKDGEVCEEAKLLRKEAGDVSVVDVNGGDNYEAMVGGQRCAKDTLVQTDVRPHPGSGQIRWIGDDGFLPCLESNISVTEVRVRED